MESNYSAKIIQASVCRGINIYTMELEYPRFIHSQVMTHRVFSRNTASSRAIKIRHYIKQVEENPALPIFYGQNGSGMSPRDELGGVESLLCRTKILEMRDNTIADVKQLEDLGLHKQSVNRYLEPWYMTKVLVTATDLENFFFLRHDKPSSGHNPAQEEVKHLAELMKKAVLECEPEEITPDMWHVPYVNRVIDLDHKQIAYYIDDGSPGGLRLTEDQAVAVSSSCSAQISFRTLVKTLKKAGRVNDKLMPQDTEVDPLHGSAFEHPAKPMSSAEWSDRMGFLDLIKERNLFFGGVWTDPEQILYCGNFRGWIQKRKLMANEAKKG